MKDRGQMISIVTTCESKRGIYKHEKDYGTSAIRLARSIRINGGAASKAPIFMWHDRYFPPAPEVIKELKKLDCILVKGSCHFPKDPLFAKINAIKDCADQAWTSHIMWMDSDTIVLQDMEDLYTIAASSDIAATATEYSHHKWAIASDTALWQTLCKVNHIDFDNYLNYSVNTMIDEKKANFYLTSGVILFDQRSPFLNRYLQIATTISASKDKFIDKQNFTQTSLTLATVVDSLRWKRLPMRFNYFYALLGEPQEDTVILHYQDNEPTSVSQELWNVNL